MGVSLPQAAEAVDRALPDHTDLGRLARAAERYGNAAVARRLGYLLELLHGSEAAEPLFPLRGRSHAHVLLSSSGPDKGPTSPRWNLRVNVDPDALTSERGDSHEFMA
jgi:predicted transcriptional regulator of viral defense system